MKFFIVSLACTFLFLAASAQQPYVTVWETTNSGVSNSDQITIPAYGDFTYTWEGVSNPGLSGSGSASGVHTITFPEGGVYRVSMLPDINGKEPFHRIEFNNGGDKAKLIDIEQWGDIGWSSFENAYYGCTVIKISDTKGAPDLSGVTNVSYAFASTPIRNVPNIGRWDVSNITNMSSMFLHASQFNDDISTWQVNNVTDMSSMFAGAVAFNQPLGFWDVSSVNNMALMFSGATAFNQDLSRWQTSNVLYMNNMFAYAASFNQHIGEWDVSNVQTMAELFAFATSFNQDISKWDVHNVRHMDNMFRGAAAFNRMLGLWELTDLGSEGRFGTNDISFAYSGMSCENYSRTLYEWATKSSTPSNIILDAVDMQYSSDPVVLGSRNKLINDKGWNIPGDAAGTCPGVVHESFVTIWKTDNKGLTNDDQIQIPAFGAFDYYYVNVSNPAINGSGNGEDRITITFPAAGTYEVAIIPSSESPFNRIAFDNGSDKLKILEIKQWGQTIWSSMEAAYYGAANLTITATDIPNLTAVTNMAYAFSETGITSVHLINAWKVHNVTNMNSLFAGAYNFNDAIGNWDVSKVTDMSYMFRGASSFNRQLDRWNVSKVTDMSYMFAGAAAFNQEIGNWNTSALTNADHMFYRATSFNKTISNWDMSHVTSMEAMFMQAENFDQPIGFWNVSSVQNMADIFNSASYFNQSLGKWNLKNLQMPGGKLNGFSFASSGMDCENYSRTLLGWSKNPETPSGIVLDATGMGYSPEKEATDARDLLINNLGWTINNDVVGACVGALTKPFITVWKTDNPGNSNNNQIMIPAEGQYSYVWEEVGNPASSGSGNAAGVTVITFPNVGIYRVSITPEVDNPFNRFNSGEAMADAHKLIEVASWGDINWSSFKDAFSQCSKLIITATDIPRLENVTDMSYAFSNTKMTAIPNLEYWDVRNVTNMYGMFFGALNFNQPLGTWNVGKVVDMGYMFSGASSFNQRLNSWDVSNVTEMSGMFSGAISFNQSLDNWNTGKVISMAGMFIYASSFNQPLNSWDVSNVTDLSDMFSNAISFNQPLDNWSTGKVINMRNMFNGASSFNQPLDSWDVSNVTEMGRMFANATSFNQPLNNWNTGSVIDMSGMFMDASGFNQPLNNWDVSKVEYMEAMFARATSFNQSINTWDITHVSFINYMFSGAVSFNQPLNNWDVSSLTEMMDLFEGATSFNQPLDNWDVGNVINMGTMFADATSFNQPLNNWDVSKVYNMNFMFHGATSFNQPLNNWDVGNVLYMNNLFRGATSFNQPIGNWDVSKVIYLIGVLEGASDFNQSLAGWNLAGLKHYTIPGNDDISFSGTAMSCDNYSLTLNGWAANTNTPTAIVMNAAGMTYGQSAEAAHNYLANNLGWTINGDALGTCTVLPVRLLSFAARSESNRAVLLWTVVNEESFKGYGVERSFDGTEWHKVGFVDAKNKSGQKSDYAYYDEQPAAQIVYYRLKLTDIDGGYTYSEIRKVVFSDNISVSVYPNPARNFVTISGLFGKSVIKLMDVTGRVLQTVTSSSSMEKINVAQLTKGVYNLVIISDKGVSTTRKIVKE